MSSSRSSSITNPFFPSQLSLLIDDGAVDSACQSSLIGNLQPGRTTSDYAQLQSQSCHAATNATFALDLHRSSGCRRMAQSEIHHSCCAERSSRRGASSMRHGEDWNGRSGRGMTVIQRLLETPKFHYDMNFDLSAIQSALKSASFLQDSGYRSIIGHLGEGSTSSAAAGELQSLDVVGDSSLTAAPAPSCRLYGTGWMVADSLSDDSDSQQRDAVVDDDNWDGLTEVGGQRIRIKDVSDVLVSRFAFISGLTTQDHQPIITFPDSRSQLSCDDFQLLVGYLAQVPPLDKDLSTSLNLSERSYVAVVDRRGDRWSSVRLLFTYLSSSQCPIAIHVVFLLKPEGVLQRALEVGYRNCWDSEKFKVVICQSAFELIHYIGADCLTMDVGGAVRYNHLEWVQHRMDIERMKSSAAVIAQSLSEFGKSLRETELPNDVDTTERILLAQTAERNAIKEDFRIAIRKGLALLRQVRQAEQKPACEQLSPNRLHNVTAIERMLGQLEDTERSFDSFWAKHLQRLTACLQLRRFEESFRKLQVVFAKHIFHLEEHRDVGDCVEAAERLAGDHDEYATSAMADIDVALSLRAEGEELVGLQEQLDLSDSLLPKCSELDRMGDMLRLALERRARVLELSRSMHAQISKANKWCRRGVELLLTSPSLPVEPPPKLRNRSPPRAIYRDEMQRLDEFLREGESLRLDSLKAETIIGVDGKAVPLATTETSNLLTQVSERIEDIKRLGLARRTALEQMAANEAKETRHELPAPMLLRRPSKLHQQQSLQSSRPVQVVSPEKVKLVDMRKASTDTTTSTSSISSLSTSSSSNGASPTKHSLNASPSSQHRTPTAEETGPSSTGGAFTHRSLSQSNSSSSSSVKANYIVEELLTTERSYVRELNEVVRFYMEPFGSPENSSALPPRLRGQSDMVFGNLRELANFHGACVLPEMERCSQSPSHLCHVLINRRGQFLALYRSYCQRSQNKSTAANGEGQQQLDQCAFFADCQRRAGHLLPLSSYLLKPIQRVTKYQLLLKELLRHCADSDRPSVQAALASMLDLLAQINSEMQQLHILGYSGDLRQLGPLRLQMECECYNFRRKTRRVGNKPKKRHLFLFDGGVLFCKRRAQPPPNNDPEYFEHKLCIAMHNLGFTAPSTSTSAPSSPRFELWDVNRSDGYAIQSSDEKLRSKWLQKLSQLSLPTSPTHSALSAAGGMHRPPIDAYSCFQMPPHTNKAVQPSTGMQQRRPSTRPQSWSSEESFKSVSSGRSSDTSALDEGNFCTPDSNGNNCFVPQRPQPQTVLCSKAANTPTANRGDRPFEWSSASGQVDVGHVTNIRIPTDSSSL